MATVGTQDGPDHASASPHARRADDGSADKDLPFLPWNEYGFSNCAARSERRSAMPVPSQATLKATRRRNRGRTGPQWGSFADRQ